MHRALIVAVLLLAACGGGPNPPLTETTTTTTAPPGPAPDAVVLTADLIGGCAMMGPNCVRYVVYGDGRVEGYRLGSGEPEYVGEIVVDPGEVAALHAAIGATDFEALRATLPEGTCMACVDGIDTYLTFAATTEFDSVSTEFPKDQPPFVIGLGIIDQAAAGIEIPIVTR